MGEIELGSEKGERAKARERRYPLSSRGTPFTWVAIRPENFIRLQNARKKFHAEPTKIYPPPPPLTHLRQHRLRL